MKSLAEYVEENPVEFRQEELILEATELMAKIMRQSSITQTELAARLHKSKPFVSQCLSGEQNLTLRTLADLFGALGYRFQVGAEPLISSAAKPISRLYPIGGWSFEQPCVHLDDGVIDCAAQATDPSDALSFLQEAAA